VKLLSLILLLPLCGCIPYTEGNVRHTIVVGFGIVSTPVKQDPELVVARVKGLGITASSVPGLKLGVGFTSSMTIAVSTNVNALVDVQNDRIQINKQ